ncbi:MAG: DNA repair protein RadA [Candidatus Jacksonbacteria bacterium RIFOXYA2_FULL_44_7]|uniref:DNA repair protein RadA n=1 Tax=Candidatus Jacksonbacteria bacterium RIFCSPLOWO2_02_FULL_44_20 TaxID=1798460 RepID=A0A1G2A856_9BACT|nr:MAG: repair protein radA protein [Parcubacteria group bacterium GW2011_GWC2_44_17]OGY70113.1 MAG: DNA repair protein RadA [Candidatus Jacksonbacteria bacterium RIFCSPHIGHO2_02_FULL_44_25]OGY71125.1 MAG: DNA repair protein RadA [Candidatus Jacksonbacteria bacterium RIFCSPHIGHO2_12_FULL_44_12]OGY72666.1 MAG: DNA repair protein RadA [Candidatus Jacksonbacteria bacterium RIFCSPLOWO2_02_FULL_44_20]OGY76953.1 MAG: DNA repair protein RadA [Candidatus Jacksonbacteria bacterium RIFOXYA2_FULL_44_7]HC
MTKQLRDTIFTCSACDAQYPKWEGRCRGCGKWGTVSELRITNYELRKDATEKAPPAELIEFKAIDATRFPRIETGIGEFDRVLGGGIVPGSLVLIGGAPGIGKSTLLLQALAKIKPPILYFSGEESASQIKSRAERLSLGSLPIQFAQETNIERVAATIDKVAPTLTIIDSIQTLKSEEVGSPAGSINQISVSCAKLMEAAKRGNHSIFIIGHITKSGVVAGPKTLEHLVDTVLYLEGDKNHFYRLLRSVKNRFGTTDEVGVFEMTDTGMDEVKNPSLAFMADFDASAPGTVTTVVMEGTRPFLVEIQALTSKTFFGYPKRATSGFKKSRLELLIAILSKRLGLRLGEQDVYLNVAGGLKIGEPAADLAAVCAIISSFHDKPLPPKTCVFGEVGLGGEVRPVAFMEKRVREAEQLGFEQILCSAVKNLASSSKIKITPVKMLSELRF